LGCFLWTLSTSPISDIMISGLESGYGVPENVEGDVIILILEAKSRDTFENAKFAQEICAKLDFANPILVTSAYHMKRAIMSFGKFGLEITPFPTGFRSCRNEQYNWKAYLPDDFKKASIAIREYLGLVFYEFAY